MSTAVWINPVTKTLRPTVTNFGNQGIAPKWATVFSLWLLPYIPMGGFICFVFVNIYTPAGHGPWAVTCDATV